MKIAISAGHNVYNNKVFDVGSVSPDRKHIEADITKRTVSKLLQYLKQQGHNVMDVTPYNQYFNSSYAAHKKRAETVNKFNPDLYLDIHMNAGGGTGPETIVYSTKSKSYKYARSITDSIASELNLTNRRGVRVRPQYWSVKLQPQPSIIIEGAFLDSPGGKDMNNFTVDKYAKAIARCFGNITDTNTNKLYKVQLGAYSKRENADRLLHDLNKNGFDGFIKLPVSTSDYFRVQTGAYSIKSNAYNLLNQLKSKGFDGFIVVEEKERYPIMNNKKSKFIQIGDTKIIKTTPDNIYIPVLGDNLFRGGFYGINGTFFDTNTSPVDNPNSCVYIAVNNGKPISNNAKLNGWNGPPRGRGTIYYTKDGKLGNRKVKSVTELPSNIDWAIGGATIKPYIDFENEKIPNSITYKTSHTYIGYDDKGYIYLIVKPNHRPSEIVPFLDGLDIKQAIMLDGGGSSQLFYEDRQHYSSRRINTAVLLKTV